MMTRLSYYLLMALTLYGCQAAAPLAPDRLLINSVEVVNRSGDVLEDLTIVVPKTRSQVVCKQVAPGGYCSNSFPPRPFERNIATITWQVSGEKWHQTLREGSLSLPQAPATFGVMIKVGKNGGLSVQVSP